MISSHWPSVCVVLVCVCVSVWVCVTGSAEPTRKWLLPICQVTGWEAVKRAFSDCQKCKQRKSEGFTQRVRERDWPKRGVGWEREDRYEEEEMKFIIAFSNPNGSFRNAQGLNLRNDDSLKTWPHSRLVSHGNNNKNTLHYHKLGIFNERPSALKWLDLSYNCIFKNKILKFTSL